MKSNLNFCTLLYIDKELNIPKNIIYTLKLLFKKVIFVDNVSYSQKAIIEYQPDIIICDIFNDSFEIYDILIKSKKLGLIKNLIITSKFKNEDILLKCIKLQVLDFLEKPLKVEEILTLMNRVSKLFAYNHNNNINFSKNLKYDFTKRSVLKDDKIIKLTKNESKLLELLISKKSIPVSRYDIEFHIWNDASVNESTFKSLLKRLRAKIGSETIKNSSGHGYYVS